MKNFVQDGDVLEFTVATEIASGEGRLTGVMFGVAQKAGKAGSKVPFKTSGVFELPYGVNAAVAEGDKIYWAAGTKNVTKTATDNTAIGVASEACDANAAVARVKLIPAI